MQFLLLLKLALVGSVFLTVFSTALAAKPIDWLFLIHNRSAALRAVLAMYGVVPTLAVIISIGFPITTAIKIALVGLALSPLPPLLPVKRLHSREQAQFLTSLVTASMLASLIAAPLYLFLLQGLFPNLLPVAPLSVLPPILVTLAVPLVLGRGAAALVSQPQAEKISSVCSKVSHAVLLLCVLLLLTQLFRPMLALVGNGTFIAIFAFLGLGILAGYGLAERAGGSHVQAPVLAWASTTRHPGVAIAIAHTAMPDERLASAAIVLCVLVNAVAGIPFLKMIIMRKGREA